jgi:hypothetical protein
VRKSWAWFRTETKKSGRRNFISKYPQNGYEEKTMKNDKSKSEKKYKVVDACGNFDQVSADYFEVNEGIAFFYRGQWLVAAYPRFVSVS